MLRSDRVLCGAAGLLLLGSAFALDQNCQHVDTHCAHGLATIHATALNEFEKFKWDYMRRLENLGSEASDEEKQHLVDIFCTKFEIRGRIYDKRLGVLKRTCERQLKSCICFDWRSRGNPEACRGGFRANVKRRGRSYRTMLEASVWECCAEIEELAGLDEPR